MKRYAMVCGLKPGAEAKYREHHARVWPGVLDMIRQCHIRNYSIFVHDGTLYSYFEYDGEDFTADMARMAADKTTQEWWAVVKPLMEPVVKRKPGEFWAEMDEVFHME